MRYGLDRAGSGLEQLVGTCECANELLGSIKCGEVYMKANDSSSYIILCLSKDNSTLSWSVQNVSEKVNKIGNY